MKKKPLTEEELATLGRAAFAGFVFAFGRMVAHIVEEEQKAAVDEAEVILMETRLG